MSQHDDPVSEPVATPSGSPEPVGSATPPQIDDDAALLVLDQLDPAQAAGLEALLFLADEPLDAVTLGDALELGAEVIEGACQGLLVRHRSERRGTEIRRVAGGWRMYSSALARPVLERWALAGRTGRLTQAALETLAVIAYKQPVSRQRVGDIRGVNADGAIRSLVARGLVAEVAREEGPGQAVLYGTTTAFLERLGLDSLDELPPITDFLPEHTAPDEPPDLAQLKEVRRSLATGSEPAANGLKEAATRKFGDLRSRLSAAGSTAAPTDPEAADAPLDDDLEDVLPPPPRSRTDRQDDAAMDALTDRLDQAARSAVHRLRAAVAASEARDELDDGEVDPDPGSDDATEGESHHG